MREIREVADLEELDRVLGLSSERPVWLFKHSVTCGTSASALRRFREFVDGQPAGESGFFGTVGVQSARPVSNSLASSTGVRHESPQVLLIRDGSVVWHASHWRITREALEKASLGMA